MLPSGNAGPLPLAQALPNIGQMMVSARGSIDWIGLLMKPMKFWKLRLPVRNPEPPIGSKQDAIGLGSFTARGAAGATGNVGVVSFGSSWAWMAEAMINNVAKL